MDLIEQIRSALFLAAGNYRLGDVSVWIHMKPYGKFSGDYWNAFELLSKHSKATQESKVVVTLGDISGHDLRSATIGMLLHYWLGSAKAYAACPSTMATHLNRLFCETFHGTGDYFTMIYSVIDVKRRMVESLSAGHPSALVIKKSSGRLFPLIQATDTNPIIGVFPKANFHATRTFVPKGSFLLYMTDGLHETRDQANRFYGRGRLHGFCSHFSRLRVGSFMQRLEEDVYNFQGRQCLQDDLSLIGVEF